MVLTMSGRVASADLEFLASAMPPRYRRPRDKAAHAHLVCTNRRDAALALPKSRSRNRSASAESSYLFAPCPRPAPSARGHLASPAPVWTSGEEETQRAHRSEQRAPGGMDRPCLGCERR